MTELPRCLYHGTDDPAGTIREGEPVVQYTTGHFPLDWDGVFVEEIGTTIYAHQRCHDNATGRTCANPSQDTSARR